MFHDGYYGDYYIKISGMTDRGPYYSARDLRYLDNGRYAYVYSKTSGERYACIDGLELGPYSRIGHVGINSAGKYLFCYRPADSKSEYDYTCIRTHDGDYGPFDAIYYSDIKFSENGDYSFHFCKNGVEYLNENGVVTTLPSRYTGNSISMDVNGHSFHSEYGFDYVVVDGQRFGKAPALECFYDDPKRVFRWYSIENQELAVYEYALD